MITLMMILFLRTEHRTLPRPWQMDYLCRCRRFLYSRLFYYLKRIHGQPPWSHLFQCTFCHVRQSVPRKPTRNLLYQLLQWCKPGKQTAIPISSSLGQNDKAQLPVNIPHSIRWNKNSQRCVFFMPCRYICPQSNHRQKNHLLLYRIRPVPCYVQTRPREFNHTV